MFTSVCLPSLANGHTWAVLCLCRVLPFERFTEMGRAETGIGLVYRAGLGTEPFPSLISPAASVDV